MVVMMTGGTGFVGRALAGQLQDPLIVSRNAARAREIVPGAGAVVEWDPGQGLFPAEKLPSKPLGAVINLMGENVGERRWTREFKSRLRDSRVLGTERLAAGLLAAGVVPSVFVSASAVGYYGDRGDEMLEEPAELGEGFLAELARDWEAAAEAMARAGSRVVKLRIGLVLGPGGGALSRMLPLFRWGLGGRLGTGRQWMPWIHLDDLVAMIRWIVENEAVHGPVNAVAPQPVRNSEFTARLAETVRRPALLPVPRLALRVALGEFGNSLCMSQRVIPRVAADAGFQWQFAELGTALRSACT